MVYKKGYRICIEKKRKCIDLTEADQLYTNFCIYVYLGRIVKRNWALLERSSTTKKMANNKLIISYKCPKNLRDFLVRAKLSKLETDISDKTGKIPNMETNKWKSKTGKCRYCDNLNTGGASGAHSVEENTIAKLMLPANLVIWYIASSVENVENNMWARPRTLSNRGFKLIELTSDQSIRNRMLANTSAKEITVGEMIWNYMWWILSMHIHNLPRHCTMK